MIDIPIEKEVKSAHVMHYLKDDQHLTKPYILYSRDREQKK